MLRPSLKKKKKKAGGKGGRKEEETDKEREMGKTKRKE